MAVVVVLVEVDDPVVVVRKDVPEVEEATGTDCPV